MSPTPRTPAADGERDEHLGRDGFHYRDHGVALVGRRGDVEEAELVGALLVVAPRGLHRIARIADVDEPDTLDDPPGVDVEAGDDALRERHRVMHSARHRVVPPGRAYRLGVEENASWGGSWSQVARR